MSALASQPVTHVNWDLTYACQLRCLHCYSQSGRRPSRDPGVVARLRIAERIAAAGPRSVAFAGGEPLLVDGVFDLACWFRARGIAVQLYTNGVELDASAAHRIADSFDAVHVSVDGAHAATHDRVRGRPGAFDAAMRGLGELDRLAPRLRFGIDATLLRSSFHEAPALVRRLSRRFERLQFVNLGAAIPAGLASMPWVAGRELPTPCQLARCTSPAFAQRLRRLAPAHVQVSVHANSDLLQPPGGFVQVEPDGAVRVLPAFEGTVGNLQHEALQDILPRRQQRLREPDMAHLLAHAASNRLAWAEATRAIDIAWSDASVRQLIAKRREPRPAAHC